MGLCRNARCLSVGALWVFGPAALVCRAQRARFAPLRGPRGLHRREDCNCDRIRRLRGRRCSCLRSTTNGGYLILFWAVRLPFVMCYLRRLRNSFTCHVVASLIHFALTVRSLQAASIVGMSYSFFSFSEDITTLYRTLIIRDLT